MLQECLNYIQRNGSEIVFQILDHIKISLAALLIATLIGVAGGYAASVSRRGEKWIMNLFQILRVIPSLAVLVLLIPVMGVGMRPAVTALAILAIPPVLTNTCVGFLEVPPFMLESARGTGMTEQELLVHVRVPLALPMILAGIRSALVEVIASATLAAKIGAGGLGEIIFTGLGLNRTDLLLIGGILTGVLSLTSLGIFGLVCRILMPYKYRRAA